MRLLLAAAVAVAMGSGSALSATLTASASATSTALPCTASSVSDAFYDLRPDIAVRLPDDEAAKARKKGVRTADYVARGHDFGVNFTVNICGAVVLPVKDVIGVADRLWANVSAYYEEKGKIYSLG